MFSLVAEQQELKLVESLNLDHRLLQQNPVVVQSTRNFSD
jgi:hypothetical protein